ncbi:MAG TPA: ABC transporter permease [Flavobacteriaceae bacterium]|nr:ABC transporter permease [Flavobacteriaceae bacterium]
MKVFLSLLGREFKLFWNNKVLLLLFLGAPILYGVLIGSVYQKGVVDNLSIVVVDQDRSELSRKAINMMEDNNSVYIAETLFDTHKMHKVAADHKATCVVVIPKNFEKDILLKRYPELISYINTSNLLTANIASSALQLSLGTLRAGIEIEALQKQGVAENIAMTQFEPFKMSFIRMNNRSTNYLYFLWPGVLATVFQQVLLLGLALSFTQEYENGTFGELIDRTSSTLKLLLVKCLPYLIMSIGIWGIYIGFATWFRVPIHNNFIALTLIAGLFVFAVAAIGILVSIILPTQLKATEVLMVIATPSFMISGFTWPLDQMPVWVQTFSNTIPLTHFLEAFRILMVESGTFKQTIPAIKSIAIIAIVCSITAYVVLWFKIRKHKKAQEA